MNLRQIEIFCAVMRSRTTIAAAYELSMSQPAVSNSLKHLEATLGMELFERIGNRLVPTPEAQALYSEAESLYSMSMAIQSKVRALRDTKQGSLSILTTIALMRSVCANAVVNFTRSRPEVRIFCDFRRMEGVIQSVESGVADLGIVIDPPPRPGLTIENVLPGTMVVAMPANHPLASQATVRAQDLANETLIGLEPLSRLGRQVREHFDQAGVPYHPNIEVRHGVTACTMVESGLGVAIVDTFSASETHQWRVVIRPFEPNLPVNVSVIYSHTRGLSRLASRFVSSLRS